MSAYSWYTSQPEVAIERLGKTATDARRKARMFEHVCSHNGEHFDKDKQRYCKHWERSTGDVWRCLYCSGDIEDEHVPSVSTDKPQYYKICTCRKD